MADVIMKSDIQLLADNPKALSRFCELLEQHATVCALNREILKESESLRIQVAAARAIKFSTDRLLDFHRKKTHPRLLMCADAIGRERGQRTGQEAGQRSILEARKFASMQLANNAPWLGEVEAEEDD